MAELNIVFIDDIKDFERRLCGRCHTCNPNNAGLGPQFQYFEYLKICYVILYHQIRKLFEFSGKSSIDAFSHYGDGIVGVQRF